MTNKIPTDDAYLRGIPTQTAQIKTGNDIDWKQPFDTATDAQNTIRRIVSFRHYAKTSQLLICQQIWAENYSSRINDITESIAEQTRDELNIWGKYLIRIDGGVEIPEDLREVYGKFFEEDDPVSVLLGMVTFTLLGLELLNDLDDENDPVFTSITDILTAEIINHQEEIIEPLKELLNEQTTEYRKSLIENLTEYLELANNTIRHQNTGFPLEQWDAEQRWKHVGNSVKQFYDDIGLTTDIVNFEK